MARMIPSIWPHETLSSAERRLYNALEEQLDDDFTVIHSLPWLDETRKIFQQGECDFLVLHPEHGLLVLEAKSGGVNYDGPSRTWLRPGGGRLNKDPFLQAQESVHHFNRLLRREVSGWSQSNPPFGYAVVFPEADQILGRLPPHVTPQLIIAEPDMDCLQDRMVSLLQHFRKPKSRMSGDVYRAAIERLLPEFQIVRSLSSQLDDQERGLARLTAEQIRLLEAMDGNLRLLVEGCAGSGKTLLALEKSMRLAHEGKRVLLLCFNIPLADWLRKRVGEAGLPIDVFHFHGLCEHVVRATGGTFEVPADAGSSFWEEEAADMLSQSLPGFAKRYDAVIVDEGQDFCAHWWIPIEELLENPDEGQLYIFHDPEQNIFNRENGFPFASPNLRLRVNCRNTHQIASFVNEMAGLQSRPADFCVPGSEPVEHVVASDEEELQEASRTLQELVEVEKVDPQRIVIIGRRRLENSPYAGATLLDGLRIASEVDAIADGAAIRYATIYRFKGLEADCAVLTGFRRPADGIPSRELYVAASRAKMLLHVMYRE
ncbi:Nuclease-related domain protein [Maioricimonas rarisocia]|uniref:Nuclease-related domain protein n=1 Tax=Maioricimonas rarisocia TaxID=2528026 RepID=A0A517Z3B2_9PLAN|nr:NERD domain-containing protein [Maioricimonas rarisocia]QDU36963.1 Nuclease-related domain protein [Maioricimonas rarisocia]